MDILKDLNIQIQDYRILMLEKNSKLRTIRIHENWDIIIINLVWTPDSSLIHFDNEFRVTMLFDKKNHDKLCYVCVSKFGEMREAWVDPKLIKKRIKRNGHVQFTFLSMRVS